MRRIIMFLLVLNFTLFGQCFIAECEEGVSLDNFIITLDGDVYTGTAVMKDGVLEITPSTSAAVDPNEPLLGLLLKEHQDNPTDSDPGNYGCFWWWKTANDRKGELQCVKDERFFKGEICAKDVDDPKKIKKFLDEGTHVGEQWLTNQCGEIVQGVTKYVWEDCQKYCNGLSKSGNVKFKGICKVNKDACGTDRKSAKCDCIIKPK